MRLTGLQIIELFVSILTAMQHICVDIINFIIQIHSRCLIKAEHDISQKSLE